MTAGRDTAGPGGADGTDVPVRLAAVFLPAPLPREGRVAFYDPEGGPEVSGQGPDVGAAAA